MPNLGLKNVCLFNMNQAHVWLRKKFEICLQLIIKTSHISQTKNLFFHLILQY